MATRKPRPARGAGRKARKAGRGRQGSARSASRPRRPVPARRAEKPRRSPETLRLRAIAPSMTVNDIERSKTFYTEALGFIVKERWTDDQGALKGVTLQAGVCELNLSQDDWVKGRDRKKGVGVRIMGETAQDVDALAARVKAAGYALAHEPRDEWGARGFSLDDPDGYHLTIYRNL
jgi:catechol 2,3-dioxygenase-like lactoylglutathione lyase family enzyme